MTGFYERGLQLVKTVQERYERLGLVWNNAKWFAGASAIYHTYHYHQDKLRADNIFGQLNIYVGYNFWRKK